MSDDGYVRAAGRPTDERRRRRRGAVLVLVLAVLLFGAFVVALAVSQGWLGRSTAPAPRAGCTPVALPVPRSITVSVNNGTDRPGLAARAARTLSEQGFRIASVRNDPLGARPENDGLVRFGPSGAAQAQVLHARFPGATLERDGRTDTVVDVVLGSTFTRVVTPTAEPTASGTS